MSRFHAKFWILSYACERCEATHGRKSYVRPATDPFILAAQACVRAARLSPAQAAKYVGVPIQQALPRAVVIESSVKRKYQHHTPHGATTAPAANAADAPSSAASASVHRRGEKQPWDSSYLSDVSAHDGSHPPLSGRKQKQRGSDAGAPHHHNHYDSEASTEFTDTEDAVAAAAVARRERERERVAATLEGIPWEQLRYVRMRVQLVPAAEAGAHPTHRFTLRPRGHQRQGQGQGLEAPSRSAPISHNRTDGISTATAAPSEPSAVTYWTPDPPSNIRLRLRRFGGSNASTWVIYEGSSRESVVGAASADLARYESSRAPPEAMGARHSQASSYPSVHHLGSEPFQVQRSQAYSGFQPPPPPSHQNLQPGFSHPAAVASGNGEVWNAQPPPVTYQQPNPTGMPAGYAPVPLSQAFAPGWSHQYSLPPPPAPTGISANSFAPSFGGAPPGLPPGAWR